MNTKEEKKLNITYSKSQDSYSIQRLVGYGVSDKSGKRVAKYKTIGYLKKSKIFSNSKLDLAKRQAKLRHDFDLKSKEILDQEKIRLEKEFKAKRGNARKEFNVDVLELLPICQKKADKEVKLTSSQVQRKTFVEEYNELTDILLSNVLFVLDINQDTELTENESLQIKDFLEKINQKFREERDLLLPKLLEKIQAFMSENKINDNSNLTQKQLDLFDDQELVIF